MEVRLRAGFVLAGGRSSRMGRDKALLPWRGTTLIEHIAAQVRMAAGSATVVGPALAFQALGYPVIEDRQPGCGPLGGILAALAHSDARWNLIVACDLPALTAAFLESLFQAAERSDSDCLIPVSPAGRMEPLCAVYRQDCLPRLTRAYEAGVRSVKKAAAGAVLWPVNDLSWFHNLNTPRDFERHCAEEAHPA